MAPSLLHSSGKRLSLPSHLCWSEAARTAQLPLYAQHRIHCTIRSSNACCHQAVIKLKLYAQHRIHCNIRSSNAGCFETVLFTTLALIADDGFAAAETCWDWWSLQICGVLGCQGWRFLERSRHCRSPWGSGHPGAALHQPSRPIGSLLKHQRSASIPCPGCFTNLNCNYKVNSELATPIKLLEPTAMLSLQIDILQSWCACCKINPE